MPRKVTMRRWRGDAVVGLDPAVVDYLLTGNLKAACRDLKARGEGVLTLWLDLELAKLWQRHEAELLAEARRRRIKPWWGRRPGADPDAA